MIAALVIIMPPSSSAPVHRAVTEVNQSNIKAGELQSQCLQC